jgi:hypothetical protein
VRALAVLAESSQRVAAQIPAGDFISMLNSGIWLDRNKASFLLTALTRQRDPEVLAQLRNRALPALIEMARWRSSGHAYAARLLLGRVAGLHEDKLQELIAAKGVDEIINAVQAGPEE